MEIIVMLQEKDLQGAKEPLEKEGGDIMKPHRKKARDYLMTIRTKTELIKYLDLLTISEEQKQVVIDMYANGLSHQQIAFKYNISIEKSRKIIQKVLDKVL